MKLGFKMYFPIETSPFSGDTDNGSGVYICCISSQPGAILHIFAISTDELPSLQESLIPVNLRKDCEPTTMVSKVAVLILCWGNEQQDVFPVSSQCFFCWVGLTVKACLWLGFGGKVRAYFTFSENLVLIG